MKIGIVTTWFERGAAYVSRQYKEALEQGHEVYIYARGGEGYAIGDTSWDGPNVTWAKKIPLHMPMAIDLEDFQKWINKNELDVVFFNEQQWWDPILLCNKLGIKTGVYVDYYTKETVPFFALYDFLICNTRRHHGLFKWHPQAVYIPWGTNLSQFKPQSIELVEPEVVTFFHSSGVSPERKGTDLLIKAFVDVIGPAKLIIHSQIDLKKFYPDLKNTIAKLESDGKLIIRIETVPAPGLYHLGDVYVYPSRLEGIGLTIAEALACGLPVIVPDNGPMNEFVDETSGKLVAVERYFRRDDGYYWDECEVSIAGLVNTMQYYVDNKESVREFKKQARAFAENKLDWLKNGASLNEIFLKSKLLPLTNKAVITEQVINFEAKRSNWRTKLYRRFPIIFKPFNIFWPIIKYFYRIKI